MAAVPDLKNLSVDEQGRLASAIMRRQARLSVSVAAVFLLILFGLPLVNWLAPDAANAPVFGFTASWLFLGLLFYPITWLLSAYFIKRSDKIEEECQNWQHLLGEKADRS